MNKRSVNDYIRTIAELGNISLAAETLGVSQPAISAALKKVESELNTVLFDRSKQPVELTDAGRVYMDYMDKLEGLHNQLTQTILDIEELKTGHIVIGGATFFNVSYLPDAIASFAGKYPDVNIEIVDGKVPELTSEAQKGMLDLFITPVVEDEARYEYVEFVNEKIYLAVPSGWDVNRKISGTVLTKEDFTTLCRHTFLILKENQHLGRLMCSLFDKFGCRPEHIIAAEQTMTTLALTLKGVGISLITESSINSMPLRERPALYIADEDLCKRSIYIADPRNQYLSKAAREFISELKAVHEKK